MARRVPSSLSKAAIAEAFRLLDVYLAEHREYGYFRTETFDGKWYDYVFEEHPPDSGIDHDHPGVTVYEVDAPKVGSKWGWFTVGGLIAIGLVAAHQRSK